MSKQEAVAITTECLASAQDLELPRKSDFTKLQNAVRNATVEAPLLIFGWQLPGLLS